MNVKICWIYVSQDRLPTCIMIHNALLQCWCWAFCGSPQMPSILVVLLQFYSALLRWCLMIVSMFCIVWWLQVYCCIRFAFLTWCILVLPSGGMVSLMNGYASTFGGPTSPSNGQIISQTNSPGSLDLYGLIHSDGNLGYLQQRAANPQFAVSSSIYTFVVSNLFYFSREDDMKKVYNSQLWNN